MQSFGAYISKHLAAFAAFLLLLLLINATVFGLTFHKTFMEDYGAASPRVMLKMAAETSTTKALPEEAAQKLRQNDIWAMYLNQAGSCFWSFDLPEEVPEHYTLSEVALFSKGYIADYPVFVWSTGDGLLILGYPKDSYTKLTSNYYSIRTVQALPCYAVGMLTVDLLLLFSAYCLSKRRILQNTDPIVAAIDTLSNGKPVALRVQGELSQVADSVNKASQILSRQNKARANWITGVSHDIRTPLSMIMGYAERISRDGTVPDPIREQAEIVKAQSIRIKELVQDLNLVSQLEYEMQPLPKAPVRLSKLPRAYAADLLNSGISDAYTIEVEIAPNAETAALECDARLISRAIHNLVQNSIQHNPQGCAIKLRLEAAEQFLSLSVADTGVGFSPETLQALEGKNHYLESADDRLDLRHGLGLLIVRQIAAAHNGALQIQSAPLHGCTILLTFPK